MKISLKFKIITTFLLVITSVSALMFVLKPTSYFAMARLRIHMQQSLEGDSLNLSQAKMITGQTVMEKVVTHHSSALSQEMIQNQILDLQRRTEVLQEGESEIFQVKVKNQNHKKAVLEVNLIADAVKQWELMDLQSAQARIISRLEQDIQNSQKKLDALQLEVSRLQKLTAPSEIDLTLERKIQEKMQEYAFLMQTYKETHPDLIEIKKEAEHLQKQLDDAPSRPTAEHEVVQKKLSGARSDFLSFHAALEEAKLKKEALVGNVDIISYASEITPGKSESSPSWILPSGLLFLIVLLGFAAFKTRP